MNTQYHGVKIKYPLKNKLFTLILVSILPLLGVTIYLIFALVNYSNAYDEIVGNMTVANNYNLDFKEEMDESLYKLAVGGASFDTISEDDSLEDPYVLLDELRSEFKKLESITTDKESRIWLQSLQRNINTLEDRVDDIKISLEQGGQYDKNIEMLDNNIYILTELIQDDIQYYIYYQTKSIENLTTLLNEQIGSFIFFCVLALSGIVIIVITVTTLVLNSITKPVGELCRVTEQISDGDFSARIDINTKDEIAVLAESVNDMTEKLEVMVNKIKEDERKMRYADLRLLQEQINPHFLYNTLDTIVWLIEGNDPDKAVSIVVSLSEFFRLVLSKGKEYISIQEEELHITSYLEIQQARYRDILDYEILINPEIYQYKILKLTIQPLVENALYHGIKYKRAKGKITITGNSMGDKIYLAVKDDGVGMEAEELEKLRAEIQRPCKETETGFGLANVNERIRMNFGSEYGMTIESSKGEGTCVRIIIPAERFSKDTTTTEEEAVSYE
ncbi:MAG TPA: sensor histidine kinase [Lachnospiraceae bacterium]|nr:sensor histidine kinase [Lachnospiraceae bacterium]